MTRIPGIRPSAIVATLIASFVLAGPAPAAAPTVRVDYYHTGDATSETFSLHQVVIEPLPWPGHPDQPIDTLRRGHFLFQVEDPETGAVLYSRGYSSIFQEWQHTGEAREMTRTFHESVRFPKPDRPVRLHVLKRNAEQVFESAWAVSVDTDDMLVARAHPPAPAPVIDLHVSGDPARKVDVAVLGEGYSAAEANKFEADARRLVEVFFAYEPYAARADDFNFRGIAPPAPESARPDKRNRCHPRRC